MQQSKRIARAVACLALVSLPLLAAACGGGGDSTTDPNVVIVQVSDNQFSPDVVIMRQGMTVKWVWSGKNAHSVMGTFGSKELTSAQHKGSGSLEFTMNDKGTFQYQCGVHGGAMSGRITVE